MSYLLGMICGNGEIQRERTETTIAIKIPHKVIRTEEIHDIPLYVQASLENIRMNIEHTISVRINTTKTNSVTTLSFTKPNADYLITEIMRLIGRATSHDNIKISGDIFDFTKDEKIYFLKGLADVTAYIRRSNNAFGNQYHHRVFIEVMNNWELAIDICNLLKSVDIPVQTIDWAHPNMRDGNLTRYNKGYKMFWKKEHQIKIWANEFLPIGFGILHKQQMLELLSRELTTNDPNKKTHQYYWEGRSMNKNHPIHPCENNEFIPAVIRGRHFDSWKDIARELGYGE
jgi:hypothetical protein